MDALISAYLDQSFLDWLLSVVAFVPAGLFLAVIVFLVGWVVAWFVSLVKMA